MKDDRGRVLIDGFYDGVEPLSPTEKRAIAEAPDIDAALMREFWLGATESSPPNGVACAGYFLLLMKAIRAFAFAVGTEPGGIVALITPLGKPLTICLSGSRIDCSR